MTGKKTVKFWGKKNSDEDTGVSADFQRALTREVMATELLRIKAETSATIVFVTHSIDEAVYLSNRVAVMSPRPGRISALHTLDLGGERNETLKDNPEFHRWLSLLRRELK